MRLLLFLFVFAMALASEVCVTYKYCHCTNKDGSVNNTATITACGDYTVIYD
ncbi:hypothetical protein LZ32DRAFT_535639 [Colletotrichum eremochloae]|nr:hypothetical protein LZ32DRAFT_535639 [Colletotrichum eremochloae]